MTDSSTNEPTPRRRRYVRAVGPRLRRLLQFILGSFALLGINSVYLSSITFAEWWSGATYQNYFYLWMFLAHLVVGVGLIVPVVLFGAFHIRNSYNRPNRRAVVAGYALYGASLLLLGSGVVLTRIEGLIEVKDPAVRGVAYWVHVICPLLVVWIYILHRLAGPRIKWKVGVTWGTVAGVFAMAMLFLHSGDPRRWNEAGPASGEQYFFPSLARTATGNFIPAETLMMDAYCQECHADAHEAWSSSAHRFASFNNPAYLLAVRETRKVALERDGDVQAARFCAGCHDLVPFFSGAFDDPDFDDVGDPTAQQGITCTGCHAITHVNSPRGNADFTIEEPVHYPFARSDSAILRWLNRQLVKAKPGFHKKTFLKPLHRTAEFCGVCHKVHLPEELNKYKWLRGQNHYDSFLLSGVSGHGVASFYYPPVAEPNCNGCHMKAVDSTDFGARRLSSGTGGKAGGDALQIHDHLFPAANTAVPLLLGRPATVVDAHEAFNEGVVRVDVFGLKRGGTIDGELLAPIRPRVPVLEAGKRYLLETVVRTLKLGHHFSQGTVDSNEIWLEVTVESGGRVIGRSGGVDDDGAVDPWSHFIRAYVLDRDGNRIDRRNAQDIFVALYDHQIPPGAGDVVHYGFTVPVDVAGPTVNVTVKLRYRKFDTTFMKLVEGEDFVNDLPVMTLAEDRVSFGVGDALESRSTLASPIPTWQRWNDYGIGLLRKGGGGGSGRGELRGAELAFKEVEALGFPDGPLNRARVYFKEGRLPEAVEALRAAAEHDPPAPPWTVAWFTGLVNKQNGHLDDAIESFRTIVENRFDGARERGFDFGVDYRVLTELGQTLIERSKLERGDARRERRDLFLSEARRYYQRALELDPENVAAHYNLGRIASTLGETELAAKHAALHAKYKPDDNARDRAVTLARRRDPAANHAAEAIVIYDLQRPGRYERSVDEFENREPR